MKATAAVLAAAGLLNSVPSAAMLERILDAQDRAILPSRQIVKAGDAEIADLSGNLKLKNVSQPTATTNLPITQSTTFAVMPEMTVTITTKGNKVILTFSASLFIANTGHGACPGGFAFFRDGVQVGNGFTVVVPDAAIQNSEQTPCFTFIDSPAAGSHTYTVQWRCNSNTAGGVANDALSRSFQAVELG